MMMHDVSIYQPVPIAAKLKPLLDYFILPTMHSYW